MYAAKRAAILLYLFTNSATSDKSDHTSPTLAVKAVIGPGEWVLKANSVPSILLLFARPNRGP